MVPRILYLHPKAYKRLIRLRKQAERDGAYRVAKRLQAVVLNSEGRTSGELAHLLGSPRSRVSEWLARYQTFSVEGLLEGHRSGRPLEVTSSQRKQLDDILESGPVAYGLDTGIWTSPMIAWVIEEDTFIDTATNTVKHTTYVGRAPHEAFFTPDGKEVWVTVRGENYVSVLDGTTYEEKTRITTPNGPGMQIFSPDGMYGYVCSSFTPETDIVSVADHTIVGTVQQVSPFCPNIAATPDGSQVWFTLKDTGKVQVFDAKPPFTLLATLVTGPITNHVNIVRNAMASSPMSRSAASTR